jgi:tRNA-Thr(GGU) m(6)t(6)A37 methyltransferase TsaA
MPRKTVKKGERLPRMTLRPVGVVKSKIKEPSLVVKSGDLDWRGALEDAKKERRAISEIVISDDLTGILDGIEEFSHILVVYWSNLASQGDRSLTRGHPMGRKNLPEVGIFATCSPARPNPICVSAVPLLERNGNSVKVRGLDAVDGSPVVDIKPYVPSYYAVKKARVGNWVTQIEKEFAEVFKDRHH